MQEGKPYNVRKRREAQALTVHLMELLQMLVFVGAWLLFLVVIGYGFGIMVMHFVGAWNNAGADKGPVLTREELRAALEKEETS